MPFLPERKGAFLPADGGNGNHIGRGFAEYCLVHRRQLNRIGDELSFERGNGGARILLPAWFGSDRSAAGDDVLIIGGGTIGQIMVRLCALSGAARIALLEPVEQKRALALRSGACMAENPFDEGYETKLLSAFPGKFNKVIECVGSKATMENAVRFAGNASVVLLFGLTAPDCAMEIRPYDLFRNEITLKASYINPYTIARAVALLNSGRLQVRDLISDVIALEDCVKVFTDASYRTRGKIIIRP
jgi:threonine dehydrogenase-like Zn-dependent dehydrogenase